MLGSLVYRHTGLWSVWGRGPHELSRRPASAPPEHLLRKPAPPAIPRQCPPDVGHGGRRGGGGGPRKALTLKSVNPNVVRLEYAVRGPVVDRAFAIMRELKQGTSKRCYNKVIEASVGDAHAMGQQPITFLRQVLSAITYPQLLKTVKYPEDVVKRAKELLSNLGGGSVGAYTAALGVERIRRHVAEYIARRDGYPARWHDVLISNGAAAAIKVVLQLFSNNPNGKKTGVMVPVPQYPLYSATIAEYGLEQVRYYLDESSCWGLTRQELERSISAAQDQGLDVRAIVVINPGNPTGQVLTLDHVKEVIRFAYDHMLFIFADEVYQENLYHGNFYSFKKVVRYLGEPYSSGVELASFMSVSKGYAGECGLRGGWAELVNMDPQVQQHLYKCISAQLSPSVIGQACADLVAKPPEEGEPSFALWRCERDAVLGCLRERAHSLAAALNDIRGLQCTAVQGAMYAFPRVTLPAKALRAAAAADQHPDLFYAFQLLEETGVCVVPGCGFGQVPGSHHFRASVLPDAELMCAMLDGIRHFHLRFTDKYA